RERLYVDRPAGVDQALDGVGDVPDVHVHAGEDVTIPEPEGDELAPLDVAAEDDLVPLGRVAGVLHADLVLVGEEVGQSVVGGGLAEHGERGGSGLVQGVRPVLDSQTLLIERMPSVRYVARGENAARTRLKSFVRNYPVVD